MTRTILVFGGLSAALLMLFELNKLSFQLSGEFSEIFIVGSGLLFISVGFLISRFLRTGQRRRHKQKASMLSKQEHKVLVLMDEGLSNHEIGEKLFISESTVKSHVSNILAKLHAKRRTEAVKIGRDLEII